MEAAMNPLPALRAGWSPEGRRYGPRKFFLWTIGSAFGGWLLLGVGLQPARGGEEMEIRREPLILRQGGTPEAPAVFDGKGMIVDLGLDVTDEPWRREGVVWYFDGPLRGRPASTDYQRAGLFVDEVPLRIVREGGPADLAPGQMGYAEDGSIFFRWPVGKTPGTCRIILPPEGLKSCVVIACSHITVRNITARHAANDGFNIHGRWVGVRLENVKAFSNGDEGISAHDFVQMDVDGAEVAWNGSSAGGVADVNHCITTYRNCEVHHNLGAAFFFDGQTHRVTDTKIHHQDQDFAIRVPEKTKVETERVEWVRE